MTSRQINAVWDLVRTLDPEPLHLVRALDAHCTGEILTEDSQTSPLVALVVSTCLWDDSCALAAEFVL